MEKKLRWLLLDANIIIELHRCRIWDTVVKRCEIYLPDVIVEEAAFFKDDAGVHHTIDLSSDQSSDSIHVFEITLAEIAKFSKQFDPLYIDRLELGEAAALTFLFQQSREWMICSADSIVYRILGNFRLGDQGIALEEILSQIGLTRPLEQWFTKKWREKWTHRGFTEGLGGIGRKR